MTIDRTQHQRWTRTERGNSLDMCAPTLAANEAQGRKRVLAVGQLRTDNELAPAIVLRLTFLLNLQLAGVRPGLFSIHSSPPVPKTGFLSLFAGAGCDVDRQPILSLRSGLSSHSLTAQSARSARLLPHASRARLLHTRGGPEGVRFDGAPLFRRLNIQLRKHADRQIANAFEAHSLSPFVVAVSNDDHPNKRIPQHVGHFIQGRGND